MIEQKYKHDQSLTLVTFLGIKKKCIVKVTVCVNFSPPICEIMPVQALADTGIFRHSCRYHFTLPRRRTANTSRRFITHAVKSREKVATKAPTGRGKQQEEDRFK